MKMKLSFLVAALTFFGAVHAQEQTVPNAKVKNINQVDIDFSEVIDSGKITGEMGGGVRNHVSSGDEESSCYVRFGYGSRLGTRSFK